MTNDTGFQIRIFLRKSSGSISWLLMPWLLASPGHQHPWYWLLRIDKFFMSCTRKDFNYLHQCGVMLETVNTVKCHYNACHYNANASLTRSILGSQTAPSWPSPSGSAHWQRVWNHRCLIGHRGNDTPLFSYKWNKTKVSHLLIMSMESINYWSSIKLLIIPLRCSENNIRYSQ